MEISEKKYCSLDIETSGFDPLTNEILEVGFAFFTVSEKGLIITEEWTQVFKPSKTVSAQILGLTGISQKELDEAPQFSEHRDFIQNKLGDAIIVGHNIAFDTKFLEGFGIKFSGDIIDTLDLVQWLLPTHHSYNLENLMHTFGISHKEAHRALADSKATLKLLEKLLNVFNNFEEKLKLDIKKLIKPYNFLWAELLNIPLPQSKEKIHASVKNNKLKEQQPTTEFNYQSGVLYNFGLGQDYPTNIIKSLQKSRNKYLLVFPKAYQALDFFHKGFADSAIFLPDQQFNSKKFKSLLKKKNLKQDEVKFLLKILVWERTNWQTETILDLNLSFFGGQFKNLINGGEIKENKSASILTCDQETFLLISNSEIYTSHNVLIFGLDEFEKTVTSDIGTKTSWSYIVYLLKSFYNLELNLGLEKFKIPVEQGITSSDLFFGLVSALFKSEDLNFQYIKISPELEYDERFVKIKTAAENYSEKLLELNAIFESEAIKSMAENLKQFFTSQNNVVKWIELAENRCTFLSMPVDIKELVENILKPFKSLSFVDALGPENLITFFLNRLGLKTFKIAEGKDFLAVKPKSGNLKQGDLFSGIKKVFKQKVSKINFHCLPGNASMEDILSLINNEQNMPAAVLFGTPAQIKEFYEKNYNLLKQKASVFAQSGSGGSNKILRNFSINSSSILLASDKFILKSLNSQSQLESVSKLEVKLLILCRLPFEQFSHPYQEAVSQALPSSFMDYALPRALFNFQSVIKFFYTPMLKDVYVIDAKLAKEYASVFKDFYKFIPNSEFKS